MYIVDCCKERNHIAVARENKLTILSSDFKETCCMSLLFQLWSDESDSEGNTIKGNHTPFSRVVYIVKSLDTEWNALISETVIFWTKSLELVELLFFWTYIFPHSLPHLLGTKRLHFVFYVTGFTCRCMIELYEILFSM